MALAPGTKLGPYAIVLPLGAGGMGEVYRAKDTRLGRDVAIKVLPENVSLDEERRQRFEREARMISSLNHPNICALYDVGNQDGMEYLVLEYVEGETVEQRLRKGPLPTKLLLRHGIEIADALEKAHRNGVVHRDLKPSNIMLTKSGAKLLDFGLAKWSVLGPSEAETLKTLTGPPEKLTEQGSLVGTFRYMAPEQLEGKKVDSRTDIFAFGEVLYEMATGVPAFSGKSKASLIAAILTAEPSPITKLQPVSPPALDKLVRGCLVKDPDERWQSAHDVKLELGALEERSGEGESSQAAKSGWRNWERLAWVVALLFVSALSVWHFSRKAPEAPQLVRSSLLPPSGSSYESYNFAVSPDGARLAFVAVGQQGKSTLWVRSLSVSGAQEFSATEDAMYPFWSPDSRRVGFFADGKLKILDTENGAVKTLCNAQTGRGGAWYSGVNRRAGIAGQYGLPQFRIFRIAERSVGLPVGRRPEFSAHLVKASNSIKFLSLATVILEYRPMGENCWLLPTTPETESTICAFTICSAGFPPGSPMVEVRRRPAGLATVNASLTSPARGTPFTSMTFPRMVLPFRRFLSKAR